MIFKFPIQRKEIVNGKLQKQKAYMDFDIDFSLASQVRFETKFPELAKHEDIYGYSQRISEVKELSQAKILSQLKLLYCWIDTDMTFMEFLKFIDLTDKEYVKEFTTSMTNAFELILNSSAEKN